MRWQRIPLLKSIRALNYFRATIGFPLFAIHGLKVLAAPTQFHPLFGEPSPPNPPNHSLSQNGRKPNDLAWQSA